MTVQWKKLQTDLKILRESRLRSKMQQKRDVTVSCKAGHKEIESKSIRRRAEPPCPFPARKVRCGRLKMVTNYLTLHSSRGRVIPLPESGQV